MNAAPTSALRDRLLGGETVYGAWASLPSVIGVRALAASGLDYVAIDLQHGGATEHDLPGLTAAIWLAGATPLARVRFAHPADVGRALDLGCAGVIIPNVDSAEQAAAITGACRYPPAGYRSAGGALASEQDPLCVVMVESPAAVAAIADTIKLPGVDGIYVGPRDLSLALGCAMDLDDPKLRAALESVWAACAAAGKPAGVHAADADTARRYRDQGCRLVTVISDTVAVSRAAAAELTAIRA